MRYTLGTLPLLLALACAESASDEGTNAPNASEDPADPPSEYIFEEEAPPSAEDSLATVEEKLQAAVELSMQMNATPIYVAYTDVMADSGGGCPYYYATEQGAYWLDSCTAASGASYDGYVFSFEEVDVVDPNSGLSTDLWYAFGGATVVDGDGNQFELGGTAALQTIQGNIGEFFYRQFTSQLVGGFQWDGASAAGTFLTDDIDPDFTIQVQEIDLLGTSATLSGGFGGFEDGWAIAYDNNVIFTAGLGSDCPEEPSGTIAVRSPAGAWYDVRFDGPANDEESVPSDACDGCGVAFYQGAELGTVCADFSSLLEWEGTPW